MRGSGRAAFAATLLLIVGVLNIIYGIGALDSANIFTDDRRFILNNLNTLGWVLIILGLIQLTGGISLISGHTYGRIIGIVAGTLGAIGSLLSIGGAYPWWSLAIFVLCVYIVHGISVLGEDERTGDLSRDEQEQPASAVVRALRAGVRSALPLRAVVMSEWTAPAVFGTVMGVQAAVIALGRAGVPALVGGMHDRLDGYAAAMALVCALLAAGALLVYVSGRPVRR